MLFWALFILRWAQATESQPNGSVGTPENITVHVLDAKTVQVFWASVWKNVERFDVTYNPTEDKIVSQAAGDSKSVVLRELRPDTQYQVTVTAVVGGRSFKSRRIVFRTAPDGAPKATQPPTSGKQTTSLAVEPATVDPTAKYMPQTSSTVRGVELGLVLLALVVWVVAIALFFHRWGKIRMLLPYQPDYKTQQALKVPGTGTTMGANCAGSSGSQNQQEGPGCVQHMRWSSGCYDERATAKKTRWKLRAASSGARGAGGSDCERGECPEATTHSCPRKNSSTESIALCQLNQTRGDGRDKKAVTISAARDAIGRRMSPEKAAERFPGECECPHHARLRDSEMDFVRYDKIEGNKYLGSLESIGDSIQSLLGCAAGYNPCQGKRNGDHLRKRYEKESPNSELEPLFFVGDREIYRNDEETPAEKVVLHRAASPTKREAAEDDALPEQARPKRYSRTSLKKQKKSLYDERELDLYLKVPIAEAAPTKNESVQTDFELDAKPKPKCNRHMAEMKRKAFLRKISLQDTYLNYNQDYWLDFKKSVRFHKSIDLGCFRNEECKTTAGDRSKPQQAAAATAERLRVGDAGDEPRPEKGAAQSPGLGAPARGHDSEGRRTTSRNPESPGGGAAGSGKAEAPAVMSDFQKSGGGAPRKCFLLPSNENIPLFCERNGFIETDFDILGGSPSDEERALLGAGEDGGAGASASAPEPRCDAHGRCDLSQFYEVKLNGDSAPEPVRRSTVFNFQGGHAFFGENRVSTSEDSDADLACEEIEIGIDSSIGSEKGFPQGASLPENSDNSRTSAKVQLQ